LRLEEQRYLRIKLEHIPFGRMMFPLKKTKQKNQDSKTLIWLFDEFKYLTVFIGVDEENK